MPHSPPRYTEASLVKALEELGVGRPSTYASILSTIQDRGYVWKRGTALVPSFTAFAVVGLLERHFGDLVDYGFTAAMEDDLDAIAQGDTEALPWLTRFYFGEGIGEDAAGSEHGSKQGEARAPNGSAAGSSTHEASNGQEHRGLKAEVAAHLGQIDAREVNSIPIGTDEDGRQIVVRVGGTVPICSEVKNGQACRRDLPPTSSRSLVRRSSSRHLPATALLASIPEAGCQSSCGAVGSVPMSSWGRPTGPGVPGLPRCSSRWIPTHSLSPRRSRC